MKRILFCWQLGANYGHLGQLLPVAEALRARGADVSFAVPDLRLAAERLASGGFAYSMSPLRLGTGPAPFPPGNFAEILLAAGFADELTATGLVHGWRRLFDLTRPDALVLDYAPFALLAARTAGIPALQISTGFDVPPPVSPFPSIRPAQAVPTERLLAAEVLVTRRICSILAAGGHTPCLSVQELFASAPTLLTTFPELDHYGPRPDANYVGPVFADVPGAPVDWPGGARRRVFAYLRASVPGTPSLLDALAGSGASVVCVLPGAPQSLSKRYASHTFRLWSRAIPLATLLTSADAVVSYGGAGLSAVALLAGAPLLIAPQVVEQELIGTRIQNIGAGLVVGDARTQVDFARALECLFDNDGHRKAARAFAQQHAGHDPAQAVQRIVVAVEALRSMTTAVGAPA